MNKEKRPVIVGIGELLWDVLPAGKRAGGAPINFVYNAAQLGAEGYAISAVGDDVSGLEILEELKKSHINHSIEKIAYPTGSVLVELQDGIPSYTIVEDVAWDHIPLTEAAVEVVKRAAAVCYGTLSLRHPDSRRTVETLLSYASGSAFKFFDINLRRNYYSAELVEKLLHHANVFKINDEEIIIVRRLFNLSGSDEDVCRCLLKKYDLRYLIFTAGEKYSIVYTADEMSYLETPKVKVIDTVGAGDAFSGAFIYSLLTGKTLREAHERAVKTAAFVCTRAGAWPEYTEEIKHG